MTAVQLVSRLSTDSTPDPADIKPGWVALLVVLVLCVATALLWLNMRKQLRKIRFEEKPIPGRRGAGRGATGDGEQPPAS